MKVARLVTISLTTRVIVEDTATDEEILQEAKENYLNKIYNDELLENLMEINEDEEMPFSEEDL
jgi:type III secretion system FlhB-like substrate exporter